MTIQVLHIASLVGTGLMALGAYMLLEKGIRKGPKVILVGCAFLAGTKVYYLIALASPMPMPFRRMELLTGLGYIGMIITGIGVYWLARHLVIAPKETTRTVEPRRGT